MMVEGAEVGFGTRARASALSQMGQHVALLLN